MPERSAQAQPANEAVWCFSRPQPNSGPSPQEFKTTVTIVNRTLVNQQALAINGGSPVRTSLLPYGRHSVDEEDIQAVAEVLRSDWLTTGPRVAEFEEALAVRLGAAHAVTFSSGTAALHAAAFAAGLGPGD